MIFTVTNGLNGNTTQDICPRTTNKINDGPLIEKAYGEAFSSTMVLNIESDFEGKKVILLVLLP